MIAPLSASSSAIARPEARSDGDSDSDWDDDDDFVAKKINIKIKPIAQMTPGKISASMDELRATVGTWKSMGNINLVKPNSRRSQHVQRPPSVTQLPTAAPPQIYHRHHLMPVALAVQECLNVRTLLGPNGESSTSLIGHVKMAVPRKIIEMNSTQFENNDLTLDFVSARVWSELKLNEELVKELPPDGLRMNNEGAPNGGCFSDPIDKTISSLSSLDLNKTDEIPKRRLAVDMRAVYFHSRDLHQRQPSSKYFLVPELFSYKIHQTVGQPASLADGRQPEPCLNPIEPVAHWLCDLGVTKVRVDMEHLEEKLNACGIAPDEVKDIKISLRVNGGVESHQSKPAASWSGVDSRLSWSFGDLNELIQSSGHNGPPSCLAKFSLRDGPSTPGAMEVQFSLVGKTLSGAQVDLGDKSGCPYLVTKQKLEARTGLFRCEPAQEPVLL